MSAIRRVYSGIAVIILGTFATFFAMCYLMYCVFDKREGYEGLAITYVAETSGFTLISTALGMGVFSIEAANKQRRRRVVFGADNHDPDRFQRVQILRWIRLFAPVFSWFWILATLIHVILCVLLGFTSKLGVGIAMTAFLMGNPIYAMVINNRLLVPTLIHSVEVIAGYATYTSPRRIVRLMSDA